MNELIDNGISRYFEVSTYIHGIGIWDLGDYGVLRQKRAAVNAFARREANYTGLGDLGLSLALGGWFIVTIKRFCRAFNL
jgi:hypothetical protein